ncbi:transport and Golgi organization protein 6 homolog isoform X2 [Hyalella azteca]|uniref:Transport and Golgi organization protein 6 homolog isoform X2 n=1 Tax=Hyalella azteca TaxID=294128 RepID=A0A979FW34_HYAAZ|nr:transport and Golgi organization protein 6 homolog isoform X2 [Hyalella azteca]
MCSVKSIILESLGIISKLGEANTSTKKEHVESTTRKALSVLSAGHASKKPPSGISCGCSRATVETRVLQQVKEMIELIEDYEEKSIIESGCVAAALLQQLLYHTDQCPGCLNATEMENSHKGSILINVKHRKVAEQVSRVVLHTAVLSCLDEEARLYPKMALVKKKALIGGRLLEVPPHCRHEFLKSCMSIMLPVFKHPYYGIGVRTNLAGEVLTAALQLCFAPAHARDYPEDCGYFRQHLEAALASVEPTIALRHLLLLRGIAATAQKSTWLLKVCTAMSVRRYLLREKNDGVRLVVRAGLDIADGDDWRQCEAVATLVARARVQDVEGFYKIIGPQVARILASEECRRVGGSVVRVMSIILSQLMQRSPSLTLQYLAAPLLSPLMQLTQRRPPCPSPDSGQFSLGDSTTSPCSKSSKSLPTSSPSSVNTTHENCEDASHSSTAGDQSTSVPNISPSNNGILHKTGDDHTCCSANDCIKCVKLSATNGDGISVTPGSSVSSTLQMNGDCSSSLTSDSGDDDDMREERKFLKIEDEDYKYQCGLTPMWEEGGAGVARCVQVLYRIIVLGGGGEGCAAVLTPALCPLLAVAAIPSPCRTRTPASNCIVKHLSNTSNSSCVEKLLMLTGLCQSVESPAVLDSVRLRISGDGGIEVEELDLEGVPINEFYNDMIGQDSYVALALVKILGQLKNPTVVRKFFSELPKLMKFQEKDKQKKNNSNLLLTEQDEIDEGLRKVRIVGMVCELLRLISEEDELMESVFVSVSEAVPMVMELLKAASEPCDEENLKKLQEAIMVLVVMMLCEFVCGARHAQCMTSSDWRSLQQVLEPMRRIKNTCSRVTIVKFIQRLEHAILTRGVISGSPDNATAQESLQQLLPTSTIPVKKGIKKEPLVQELPSKTNLKSSNLDIVAKKCKRDVENENSNTTFERNVDVNEDNEEDTVLDDRLKSVYNPYVEASSSTSVAVISSSSTPIVTCNNKNSTLKHDFDTAMEEVFSPLVPVCGHALISFTKLIEAGDEKAKANSVEILGLFEHHLKNEDSYVYLAAVEGLSALCDAFPDKLVPIICDEMKSDRSAVDRAKMAEVITRSARRLSSALPKYKQYFFNSLLGGVKDEDPIVRAACLSSLGEVCKELRLSVGPEAVEIFSVIETVIRCDDVVEPRRAALLLATLLLRGLGTDAIRFLSDVLKDLYQRLKEAAKKDKDEVTRTHAVVALDELDSIMRAFLVPKLNTTKKIYIKEAPPKLF